VKQLNGKDYIFLCLNGKTVKETPEGQDEPQTFYEYDYTEITAETGAVDLDDVKKNPDQYATYEPEREKKPEEKIAELEEKVESQALLLQYLAEMADVYIPE
jgi:hypothetical protein